MSGHAVEPEPRCQVCGKTYANGERFCSLDGGPVLAPLEGQTIDGRYRIVRQLGKGGMGVVYEAEHVALGKPIAVKFLSATLADADAQARFVREAKIASRIVHEHVVQIFDVGLHDGRNYLVMELVAGRDLRQTLTADGPLAPARAVKIAVQMLRGLAAIHHAGILHRDIKPANVLLTERDGDPDFVKIMDFGISKSIDGATTSAGTLTDTGKVIGTPQYMAPEQLVGAPSDHRADVYAVGLTLYAMLAGEAPFASTSFTKVAAMHVSVEAPPVDTFRPGLPLPLVQAVSKALSKAPEGRFHDAAQMADVLESIELPDDVPPVVDVGATVRERPAVSSAIQKSDEPTVKASPAARRRYLVPALAISGSILIGAILITRALREDDEAAPKRPPAQPPTQPAGAAAIEAMVIDAPSSAMHMQYALEAEREGQLEAAIGAYEAVYALEKGPGILWHIAELHERSGDRAKAAETLRRYLAVAPPGAERDAAEKRIAWLDPPAADAGVAAKPRLTNPFVAKTEGATCACVTKDTRSSLCPKVGRSTCTCHDAELGPDAALCSRPFVPCDGGACDKENPAVRCPTTYVTTSRLAAGESCSGYFPTNNLRMQGTFACDACPDLDRRAYRGRPGDPCEGVDGASGKPMPGTLDACAAAR